MLLLQSHLEFQVVTPRTLASFHGDVLILPDARCLGKAELDYLGSYTGSGKSLIVTGQTGKYDETGASLAPNPVHKLLGIGDSANKKVGRSDRKFIYYPSCPGKDYYAHLRKEFDRQAAAGAWEQTEFSKLGRAYVGEIMEVSGFKPAVEIEASPYVSAQISSVEGKVSVFLANFKGLKAKQIAQQIPERHVKIVFDARSQSTISILPFLGNLQKVQGTWSNGKLTCELPAIEKGAVVWVE